MKSRYKDLIKLILSINDDYHPLTIKEFLDHSGYGQYYIEFMDDLYGYDGEEDHDYDEW